ncbi:pyrimidine-nucleoside phosphorylase [Helicovermis profundi]|uniref:Pyrimidine-nucleoside phosphorylase n=1 Tax=Helicovermis profundi TaxID=3065157 RepID=A0AAU9ELS9_9FIRM|nr:pyrimidine-nucleoside phosphorylase [Clostridia bacterium S502]
MRMYDIIAKKRDGIELTTEEIQFFISGYTDGSIPDYQASALLMAIFLQKMNTRETVDLTYAMMNSGDTIDLSNINGIKVDKHSTGGVGDTTTLILGPLVASCGVPVAKMSGRGLGHTGGTLDKLESIDGFHIELTTEEFIENVNTHKIAVVGQTSNIAPADKKLYALRDVTATVDNISLIAASVMSKKLAAGSDAIVLDVKCGSGAFVKDINGAVELSTAMVNIGNGMKRNTIAIITDMEQPLGYAVGNALEVKEAIDTLNNIGPKDLTDLVVTLASNMVYLGEGASSVEEAKKLVLENLSNGKALTKFKEFIECQGGNVEVIDDISKLPDAKIIVQIKSPEDGYVKSIKSDDIGIAAMVLGAGRETKDDILDLGAGIMLKKKVGDKVTKGDVIAVLYANKEEKIEDSKRRLLNAYTFTSEFVESRKLILGLVKDDKVELF